MPIKNGNRGVISADPKKIEDLEHRLKEATKTIEEQRRQLLTMGETADSPLFDAIATMSEGFALFDAEDRLQLFNRRYVEEIWPQIADILVPGVTFETIVRETIKRGVWMGTDINLETLVKAAMTRHRDLPSVHEIGYPNGRWIRQSKQLTASGGVVAVYADITEIKRRETALEESEARYRDLIEGSELGIQIGSRDRGRIFANQACADLFGYDSVDEILSVPRMQLVAAYDRDRSTGYRNTLYEGGTPVTAYEIDGIRKDGSIIPVQVFMRRILWAGEDAIQRTFIDLTERNLVEMELRESEHRYRTLVNASPEIIYLHCDGKLAYANGAALKLFGAETVDSILGMDSIDFIHPDDQGLARTRRLQTSSSEEPLDLAEVRYLLSDGSVVDVEITSAPIMWEGKQAHLVFGRDVTDRKLAENALRLSEERFSSVFNNSPAAISLKDLDGRFRLVNMRFLQWFGVAEEDVLGKTAAEVLPSELAGASMAHDRRTLDTGVVTEREQEIEFVSGQKAVVVITKFPVLNHDGKSIGIGTMMTDVSEERKTAAQLRQSQKMEAVGQLTGGVAHDFNNLLTVICGNLELIAERVGDPALGRMAQTAINASTRGAELTQRLLAFSRIQSLVPEVVDLNELVVGMTDLMRRTLGETIEIDATGGDDVWKCNADPGQLEGAILNLALNARDAMPEGGKLTIETSNSMLDDLDVAARNDVSPGDYVKVSVSDTGTGMSRNEIDHAFEPFFTTKDVGAGSGLGLSMVHGFINQSGGFVIINSVEGDGTTVNLYLPRTVETCAPVRQSPKGKDPLSQGEKVLVVEDDPEVRALTVNMLADLGYDTVEAADGNEAIEVLQHTPGIDLLFTDVGLPGGMSGIDIAREVIQRFPDISILFTSGYAEDVLVRRGKIDDEFQLIKKPFRKKELARKVRTILDQSVQ